MSETPEEERPAETTASHPVTPPAPEPAPAPAPVQRPVEPLHQRRSVQLVAIGLIGLLLGGIIGLGIGLTAGFAFGGHQGRGDMGRHQHYGPGFRGPDRNVVPQRPFGPMRKQPNQPVQPVQPGQPSAVPSPQAS